MSHAPRAHTLYTHAPCWIVRGTGLLVNGFFLFILYLNVTGGDNLRPQSWPTIIALTVCILGVFTALRWEQVGGRITLGAAGALMAALIYASLVLELGWQGFVLALAYPVPFFLVGSLFLADAPASESVAASETDLID